MVSFCTKIQREENGATNDGFHPSRAVGSQIIPYFFPSKKKGRTWTLTGAPSRRAPPPRTQPRPQHFFVFLKSKTKFDENETWGVCRKKPFILRKEKGCKKKKSLSFYFEDLDAGKENLSVRRRRIPPLLSTAGEDLDAGSSSCCSDLDAG